MTPLNQNQISREDRAWSACRGKVVSFSHWVVREWVLRRGLGTLVSIHRQFGNRIKAVHFLNPLALANARKANSNALEYRLEESSGYDAVAQLRDRLIAGMNFREAVDFCEDELGVATSLGAMSGFHKRVCAPFLAERTSQSHTLALSLSDEFSPQDFDKAARLLMAQDAFDLLSDRSADPKVRAASVANLLKARAQDLDLEKFRVALKSKTDAGFDALYEEIRGNEKAEEIFAKLREAVAGA